MWMIAHLYNERMRDRLRWVEFSGALINAVADWSLKTCQTGSLGKFPDVAALRGRVFQKFARKTEMNMTNNREAYGLLF